MKILHHLQLCALASLPFAGADEDNYVPSNEIEDDDQHEHGIYSCFIKQLIKKCFLVQVNLCFAIESHNFKTPLTSSNEYTKYS